MTRKFTLTIPAGEIDLVSPMDWVACHAEVLKTMGIKDANPLTSEAEADKVSKLAALKAEKANLGKARP